jgi:carbon storage regulator
MLVLSRKKDESITIGENITITVVEIFGDKVRLGITAPPEVRIDRKEIRVKKDEKKNGLERSAS